MKSFEVQALIETLVGTDHLTVLATTGPGKRLQQGPLALCAHCLVWEWVENLVTRLNGSDGWGVVRNVLINDEQERLWILHADEKARVVLAIGPVDDGSPCSLEKVLRLLTAPAPRRNARPEGEEFNVNSINRTYGPEMIDAIRTGDLETFDEMGENLIQWWQTMFVEGPRERIFGVHIAFIAYAEAAAVKGGADPEVAEALASACLRTVELATTPQEAVVTLVPQLRQLAQQVAQSRLVGRSAPVRTMVRYLVHNLHRSVTLQEAAAAAGLSPNYAGTLLKQEGGEGFTDTLRRLRVERAKTLLKTTRDPIQEIANQVGFRQPDYFTKVFQAQTGCTPREFRRSVWETVGSSGK